MSTAKQWDYKRFPMIKAGFQFQAGDILYTVHWEMLTAHTWEVWVLGGNLQQGDFIDITDKNPAIRTSYDFLKKALALLDMKTYKIKKSNCLSCEKELSVAAGSSEAGAPQEGDYSVCTNCGTISKFDRDMNLVRVDRNEIDELRKKEPDFWRELHNAAVAIVDGVLKNMLKKKNE